MNIESRLTRLEAENRLLKGVALLALTVAVLPWMMGSEAAIQDHVQARRFTLIGDDEKPAGSWSFDQETKTATLSVRSSERGPSVVLASSDDHSTVRLVKGVKRPPEPFVVPGRANRAAEELATADIAMTAGMGDATIDLKDGSIAIQRHGKKAFVLPPQATFLPVARE